MPPFSESVIAPSVRPCVAGSRLSEEVDVECSGESCSFQQDDVIECREECELSYRFPRPKPQE